jgi:hypothetical protein
MLYCETTCPLVGGKSIAARRFFVILCHSDPLPITIPKAGQFLGLLGKRGLHRRFIGFLDRGWLLYRLLWRFFFWLGRDGRFRRLLPTALGDNRGD